MITFCTCYSFNNDVTLHQISLNGVNITWQTTAKHLGNFHIYNIHAEIDICIKAGDRVATVNRLNIVFASVLAEFKFCNKRSVPRGMAIKPGSWARHVVISCMSDVDWQAANLWYSFLPPHHLFLPLEFSQSGADSWVAARQGWIGANRQYTHASHMQCFDLVRKVTPMSHIAKMTCTVLKIFCHISSHPVEAESSWILRWYNSLLHGWKVRLPSIYIFLASILIGIEFLRGVYVSALGNAQMN